MSEMAHLHENAVVNPVVGDIKEQEKINLLIAVYFNTALLEQRLGYSLKL